MNPQKIRMIEDWDYQHELCQIHKTNSNSSDTDLLSFEDSTFVSDLSSSRPPSSTSFLDDEFTKATSSSNAQTSFITRSMTTTTNSHQGSSGQKNESGNSSNSVYVMVSGTSFSVPGDAYHKIRKLPWQRDHQGILHLYTSPAVFEVLLGHIVFETLPAYDTLSNTEYEEFEPMALCLGLYDLVEHFGRSSDKRLRHRTSRRRSSLLKKNHRGSHIVLNSETANKNAASTKVMAANHKAARFVASLTRQGRNSLKTRKMKATHDQWCASDHIN